MFNWKTVIDIEEILRKIIRYTALNTWCYISFDTVGVIFLLFIIYGRNIV